MLLDLDLEPPARLELDLADDMLAGIGFKKLECLLQKLGFLCKVQKSSVQVFN